MGPDGYVLATALCTGLSRTLAFLLPWVSPPNPPLLFLNFFWGKPAKRAVRNSRVLTWAPKAWAPVPALCWGAVGPWASLVTSVL